MSGVYLDWNATAPLLPEAIAAMTDAMAAWGNPSSVHAEGRRARAVVEDAREAVAACVRADPRDLLLTSGATEANNLALRGATALVTSRLEHPSVVRVAEALEREGRRVAWLPVPRSGRLDPGDLERASRDLPPGFTAAIQAASHETGVIQPVAEAAAVVRAAGGRLHVDAVQAVGKLEPELLDAADSLAFSADKLGGPKGIGALVWRGPDPPRPVLLGGAQERGLRPGTLDPVAAAGFGAAARRAAAAGRRERTTAMADLRDRIETALAGLADVNGDGPRLPHVTSLHVAGHRADALVARLDLDGVRISSGSACSAGSQEPSPVITAMLGEARARASLRLSLGESTTPEDVELAVSLLKRALGRRSSSA